MSHIALTNAWFRSRELNEAASRRIVEDPEAVALVRASFRLRAVWSLRGLVPGLPRLVEELRTVHCVRHASVDALIKAALANGATQVVLLGAGLDSRATRIGQRHPRVRWFEVDRSPHITHKQDTLSDREAWVDHVHADISQPGWDERLRAAGLDPRQRTVWVAEGLIHYLPEGTLDSLLWMIRGTTPDAEFVLSTIHPDTAGRARGTLVRILRWLQELPRIVFTPETLAAAAARAGWEAPQFWDYAAQVDTFAPQARGRPAGVSQDIVRFVHPGPRA